MGRLIIKIEDPVDRKEYYLEWSTIIEMPITWGVTLPDFCEYYRWQYGRQGMKELPERLARVEQTGLSSDYPDADMDAMFECSAINQENGIKSREDLLNRFCRVRKG